MGCNLELGLLPCSSASASASASSTFSMGSNSNNAESPKQEQMMTIFYNGKICVCDVTEIQAKNIISLASRKTTEGRQRLLSPTRRADQNSQALQFCPKTDLSMKRSLRQFLEKRKNRIQATGPYHH